MPRAGHGHSPLSALSESQQGAMGAPESNGEGGQESQSHLEKGEGENPPSDLLRAGSGSPALWRPGSSAPQDGTPSPRPGRVSRLSPFPWDGVTQRGAGDWHPRATPAPPPPPRAGLSVNPRRRPGWGGDPAGAPAQLFSPPRPSRAGGTGTRPPTAGSTGWSPRGSA